MRAAHIDLEGISVDREVRRLRDMISARFSDVCYNGFWFSPEMEFMLNAMKKSQEVGIYFLKYFTLLITLLKLTYIYIYECIIIICVRLWKVKLR